MLEGVMSNYQLVVPFTITFTPGKADPSSADDTFPETVRSCAHRESAKTNAQDVSRNFFIGFSLGLKKLY
jgi:hypothetical protein